MKTPGLRHSAQQVGGIVFFGRMLDKILLHSKGKLPADYKVGAGTDLRVCRFLGVDYQALVKRALAEAPKRRFWNGVLRMAGDPTPRRF